MMMITNFYVPSFIAPLTPRFESHTNTQRLSISELLAQSVDIRSRSCVSTGRELFLLFNRFTVIPRGFSLAQMENRTLKIDCRRLFRCWSNDENRRKGSIDTFWWNRLLILSKIFTHVSLIIALSTSSYSFMSDDFITWSGEHSSAIFGFPKIFCFNWVNTCIFQTVFHTLSSNMVTAVVTVISKTQ